MDISDIVEIIELCILCSYGMAMFHYCACAIRNAWARGTTRCMVKVASHSHAVKNGEGKQRWI